MEIVTLHLSILCLTALCILYADFLGQAYMRGTVSVIPTSRIRMLHSVVLIGLLGMVGTGIVLSLPMLEYLLGTPAFYVKMVFVLTLLWNSAFIGRLNHYASETPFRELSPDVRTTLVASGVVSAVGWVGATIIGFFFL